MSVERNIRFDLIARLCPNASGAELRSVCTEAGMFAIRSVFSFHFLFPQWYPDLFSCPFLSRARRKVATEKDFLDAVEKVIRQGSKFSSTAMYSQYRTSYVHFPLPFRPNTAVCYLQNERGSAAGNFALHEAWNPTVFYFHLSGTSNWGWGCCFRRLRLAACDKSAPFVRELSLGSLSAATESRELADRQVVTSCSPRFKTLLIGVPSTYHPAAAHTKGSRTQKDER